MMRLLYIRCRSLQNDSTSFYRARQLPIVLFSIESQYRRQAKYSLTNILKHCVNTFLTQNHVLALFTRLLVNPIDKAPYFYALLRQQTTLRSLGR